MSKKPVVPDAWDDDWESIADREAQSSTPSEETQLKVSKAERLAAHAESNKKLWESAEQPETFHFLAARDEVPLKSEFKPALKVLSRRPTPQMIARRDPVTGLSQLSVEDDGEEDAPKLGPTAEELRAKAQKEREEKQRKYEEVRARLFGTDGDSSSGREEERSRGSGRGRGRGRGNRHDRDRSERSRQERQEYQDRLQRIRNETPTKELYDPNYTSKPGQRAGTESPRSGFSTPRDEDQLVRTPRGPGNSSNRGFANRGSRGG